jgi:hypothetical protein
MRCDQCQTDLGPADFDAQRGVGLCPQCGNLVRIGAPALLDPANEVAIAPWQNHASSPFREAARLPEIAPQNPLSVHAALGWTEREIAGGGLEIHVTTQPGGPMTSLFVGLFCVLSGGAAFFAIVIQTGPTSGFASFIAAVFLVVGAYLIRRAFGAMGAATFRFRPGMLEYETKSEVARVSPLDVVEFANAVTTSVESGKNGTMNNLFFELQLRTRTGVFHAPLRLSGERRAKELTERLNALLRAIRTTNT